MVDHVAGAKVIQGDVQAAGAQVVVDLVAGAHVVVDQLAGAKVVD